jgi:predicted nucleotidyltransferase
VSTGWTIEALHDVVARDEDVEVAALFGSATRDRLGPESDVDVYLRLRRGVRWSSSRENQLTRALERVVGREVDLIVEDRDTTSALLRMEVARSGRLVFERTPGAWTSLRADALVTYADLEPFMRICEAGVRRRIRRGASG